MSTQNFKDVVSKSFGLTHNIGSGGVDCWGGSMVNIPNNLKRMNQRYDRIKLIFGDQLALKKIG